jgi:hypothetical protein
MHAISTNKRSIGSSPWLRRLRSWWSVGVDAAFDLGDTLLMPQDHRRDCDRASDQESDNRNQQTAQARYRVD